MASPTCVRELKILNPICAVAAELGLPLTGRRTPMPPAVARASGSTDPELAFDPEGHGMYAHPSGTKLGSVIDLVMALRECDQDGAVAWLRERVARRGLDTMRREGIVLVDHGSRRAEANAVLLDVAATVQVASPDHIVHIAHMELAAPAIADAFAACVKDGAVRVVVHPYFLAPGKHAVGDIPRQTADAAERFPDVPCSVSPPLGLHPALADIILARVAEAE